MYKITMESVDFGGTKRTEDYYFNLTQAELVEMQLTTEGGYKEMIEKVLNAKDIKTMSQVFKTILCKAYGVVSPDGRKFVKNQAVLDDFLATQAYSDLYMKLVTDDEAAADFFNKVIPQMEEKPVPAQAAQPGLAVLSAAPEA